MDGLIPGNLILEEIRAVRTEMQDLRKDMQGWQQDTGERIATIESQIKPTIIGNGQPSRLAVVEEQVDELRRDRWRLTGAASAGGAIIGVVIDLARKKLGL
jgi:hypothetical protein